MRRVEGRLRELEVLVGRCEGDSRSLRRKASLEAELRRAGHFWLPEAYRNRLNQLGLHLAADLLPPGRALGVVVQPDVGGAALVWVVVEWVEAGAISASPMPAGLSAGTQESLRWGAATAARLYPFPTTLHADRDLRYRILTLEGENLSPEQEVTGQSFGLAAAVATWSLLSGRPASGPHGVPVFTGAVGASLLNSQTPVTEVSEIATKWGEVAPTSLAFVFPSAVASQLPAVPGRHHPVSTVGEALKLAFGVDWNAPERCPAPPRTDAAVALERLDLEYRRNAGDRWSEQAARFEELLRHPLPEGLRALALARAGACYTHLERMDRADTLLRSALEAVERAGSGEVEGWVEVVVRTHLAIVLRDRYLLEEARAEVEQAYRLGEQLRVHKDAINARSTLGQLLTAMGRSEEAVPHLEAARDFYDRRHSEECPRNHTYLVEALGRLGRLDEARREYELGLEHNRERAPSANTRVNQAFLDYALLSGRLRSYRRRPTEADWAGLARDAALAVAGVPVDWPRAGLQRVAWAAAMRTAGSPGARTELLEQVRATARVYAGEPLLHWQSGMVLLEAALVETSPVTARQFVGEGMNYVRPNWLPLVPLVEQVGTASGPAFTEAVLRILETEQY